DRRVALDLVPRRAGADRDRGRLDADEPELAEAPQIEDPRRLRPVVRVDHQIGAAGEHHVVGMRGARCHRLRERTRPYVRRHRVTSRAAATIASTISWYPVQRQMLPASSSRTCARAD